MPREAKTNTMGGDQPRIEGDAYYTPDALALAICRRVRETLTDDAEKMDAPLGLWLPQCIIEPSAGAGAFVRAAMAVWPLTPITAIDPGERPALIDPGVNWVQATWEAPGVKPPDGSLLVLGNPPYNLAQAHIELALARLQSRPTSWALVLLLRQAFLASKKRVAWLKSTPLAAVWNVSPRPSFTGGGTDGAEYAVLCWSPHHPPGEPYLGHWLEWSKSDV